MHENQQLFELPAQSKLADIYKALIIYNIRKSNLIIKICEQESNEFKNF